MHTSDLHSYWEHSSLRDLGGYARIKSLMDSFEAEGNQKGWVSVRLDSGDFSEGNINFFADGGQSSFRIMQAMNYDAIALGNHDYLTGVAELVEREKDPTQRLPLVAANFINPNSWHPMEGKVIQRGGLKIAVVGATTYEKTYRWVVAPAQITPPNLAIEGWIKQHQDADLKIALTHIGINGDRVLATHVAGIDLILGGHSHTLLTEPAHMFNFPSRKMMPIFHSGCHGEYVERILIELGDDKSWKVVSHAVVQVRKEFPQDPKIQSMVLNGISQLQKQTPKPLTEVVGEAKQTFFTHKVKAPVIGNLFADSIREFAGTQLAFDSGKLYSDLVEQGPVTVQDIMNLAPHVYNWSTGGWHIYTCETSGAKLYEMLEVTNFFSEALCVSGMEVKMAVWGIGTISINGKPIGLRDHFTLAMSEGIARGATSYPWLKTILCDPLKDSGLLVRDALFTKLTKIGQLDPVTLGASRISGAVSDMKILKKH